VSNAQDPHSQLSTITLISRSIADAELFSSDVLESGTPLAHLVSPKNYLFLRRKKAVLLVSRIGFWEFTSNELTRR
jgi:hypothetical protein